MGKKLSENDQEFGEDDYPEDDEEETEEENQKEKEENKEENKKEEEEGTEYEVENKEEDEDEINISFDEKDNEQNNEEEEEEEEEYEYEDDIYRNNYDWEDDRGQEDEEDNINEEIADENIENPKKIDPEIERIRREWEEEPEEIVEDISNMNIEDWTEDTEENTEKNVEESDDNTQLPGYDDWKEENQNYGLDQENSIDNSEVNHNKQEKKGTKKTPSRNKKLNNGININIKEQYTTISQKNNKNQINPGKNIKQIREERKKYESAMENLEEEYKKLGITRDFIITKEFNTSMMDKIEKEYELLENIKNKMKGIKKSDTAKFEKKNDEKEIKILQNETNKDLNSDRIKKIRADIEKEIQNSQDKILGNDGKYHNINSSEEITKNFTPESELTEKQKRINEVGYIYLIQNKINDKIYIGQTCKNVDERWKNHIKNARYSSSKNSAIHNSINKHGKFNFTISEELKLINETQHSLDLFEKYYIQKFKATSNKYGYNLTDGGSGGKHNQEIIEKIRQSNIEAAKGKVGVPLSQEHRNKISESLKGHQVSYETRKKQSKSATGRKLSEDTKKKLSELNLGKKNPQWGMKHSEETKQKMSKVKMGDKNPFYKKHHTKEGKKKIGNGNRGKIVSEETKIKISKAKIGHHVSKETRKKLSEANKGKKNPNYGKKYTEEETRKISESNRKTYRENHPIDEEKFKKWVKDSEIKVFEIKKEFNLTDRSIVTWLKHTFEENSVTKIRKKIKNCIKIIDNNKPE